MIKDESESHSLVSNSLWLHGLYSPWYSPGQNTGVGSLLQGIFPTQGSNPGLPHCRWILYQLSHQGNPRALEWVAYPFSRGSSRPRNPTGVSWIVGRFFINWAMRKARRSTCTLTWVAAEHAPRVAAEPGSPSPSGPVGCRPVGGPKPPDSLAPEWSQAQTDNQAHYWNTDD